MPRIIVTTQPHGDDVGQQILLNEDVRSVHLSTNHAASQLVQRLIWAISDAEKSEARQAGELLSIVPHVSAGRSLAIHQGS